jgi:exonuclease III
MRIISANLNKRLGNPTVARYVAAWLSKHACDVFLSQEPWARTRDDTVELNGYKSIGGNSSIQTWLASRYAMPVLKEHDADWHQVDLGYITLHNLYLSPYSSTARASKLLDLLREIEGATDRPQIIVGDFNLAPQPTDGIMGDHISKWTSTDERSAFNALLAIGKLVDMTSEDCLGSREYSIERKRKDEDIRFRCDLALVSDYISNSLDVRYDHSTRIGPTAFTDHSAVIIDVLLSLPQANLFTLLANDGLDAPEGESFQPHKTAMSRSGPSKIATELQASGLLDHLKVKSVLDFGCGRGRDVDFYRSIGLVADGYDPYPPFGWNTLPNNTYDLVTVVFVLNVLQDPWERLKALRVAMDRVKEGGYLFVVTRSSNAIQREAKTKGWEQFNDGYFSHKGRRTFQKGLDQSDIIKLTHRLGLVPHICTLNVGPDASYVLAQRLTTP